MANIFRFCNNCIIFLLTYNNIRKQIFFTFFVSGVSRVAGVWIRRRTVRRLGDLPGRHFAVFDLLRLIGRLLKVVQGHRRHVLVDEHLLALDTLACDTRRRRTSATRRATWPRGPGATSGGYTTKLFLQFSQNKATDYYGKPMLGYLLTGTVSWITTHG